MGPAIFIGSKMKPTRAFFILLLLLLGISLSGCKDTKATHDAGLLETCKYALDQSLWDDAITACSLVLTDDGYHLTAQAYMGRADASLFTILSNLSGSGGMAALINGLPTATQAKDYLLALDLLLGSIKKPDQSVYLEGLLLSSMLVLKETTALLSLEVDAAGNVTHCASSGSISSCSFNFALDQGTFSSTDVVAGEIPVSLTFSGMGTTFYTGVCGHSTSESHTTKVVDATSDLANGSGGYYPLKITEKMTVNGCTVQSNSPLYYNKVASENLTTSITGLDKLNFYSKMDTGNNYTQTLTKGVDTSTDINVCNSDAIPVTGVADGKLNDCEILYFMQHLSL